MCYRQNGLLICWSWGRNSHNEYIQLWQLWKTLQSTSQSKKTFRWYSFREIVPVWNVRQTIYCQKKFIVTPQAPSIILIIPDNFPIFGLCKLFYRNENISCLSAWSLIFVFYQFSIFSNGGGHMFDGGWCDQP